MRLMGEGNSCRGEGRNHLEEVGLGEMIILKMGLHWDERAYVDLINLTKDWDRWRALCKR